MFVPVYNVTINAIQILLILLTTLIEFNGKFTYLSLSQIILDYIIIQNIFKYNICVPQIVQVYCHKSKQMIRYYPCIYG